MILTGIEIENQHRAGRIQIEPFNPNQLTTNSYDLRLGKRLIRYLSQVLDPREKPEYELLEIPESGLLLDTGAFVLGESFERLGSNHYVPIVHAKSGIARLGLFVHVTADLIDIGSIGNSTFQLFATLPIRIFPGMLIAQVSFWIPSGEIKLYEGKYQGSDGPQISKTYLDYEVPKAPLPR
jgi:dCTP deaminase